MFLTKRIIWFAVSEMMGHPATMNAMLCGRAEGDVRQPVAFLSDLRWLSRADGISSPPIWGRGNSVNLTLTQGTEMKRRPNNSLRKIFNSMAKREAITILPPDMVIYGLTGIVTRIEALENSDHEYDVKFDTGKSMYCWAK